MAPQTDNSARHVVRLANMQTWVRFFHGIFLAPCAMPPCHHISSKRVDIRLNWKHSTDFIICWLLSDDDDDDDAPRWCGRSYVWRGGHSVRSVDLARGGTHRRLWRRRTCVTETSPAGKKNAETLKPLAGLRPLAKNSSCWWSRTRMIRSFRHLDWSRDVGRMFGCLRWTSAGSPIDARGGSSWQRWRFWFWSFFQRKIKLTWLLAWPASTGTSVFRSEADDRWVEHARCLVHPHQAKSSLRKVLHSTSSKRSTGWVQMTLKACAAKFTSWYDDL